MTISKERKTTNQQFISDVKAIFLQEQEENLAPYLYSTPNSGIEEDMANGEVCYYNLLSNNPGYYLYKEEIELINNVASKLAASVPPEANLIELGPGTDIAFKNKTLPFLQEIKQLKSYVPVDLCQTYLDDSE